MYDLNNYLLLYREEIEEKHEDIKGELTAHMKKRHREATKKTRRRNLTSMGSHDF